MDLVGNIMTDTYSLDNVSSPAISSSRASSDAETVAAVSANVSQTSELPIVGFTRRTHDSLERK